MMENPKLWSGCSYRYRNSQYQCLGREPSPTLFESDTKNEKINHFWTIRVEDAELQGHTFAIQSKGDCFLSANTKLVGFDKAVQLSSEALAVAFCEAVSPTLRRRHGEAASLMLATCQTRSTRVDDALVRARIEHGVFTPIGSGKIAGATK
jgi:hypothetical protein